MMQVLPLFKSHYSLGRSILTLEDDLEKIKPNAPQSIIDICVKNKMDTLYLVENGFTGFFHALEACQKHKIKLRFGVQLTCCLDIDKKDEDSRVNNHKVIVFLTDERAYSAICKLYTESWTKGQYYVNRVDYNLLRERWNENFILAHPFYDGFLHTNLMSFSTIVPDYGFTKPIFFLEDHDLPFDPCIKKAVINYCTKNNETLLPAHSIYYKDRQDFKQYMVFRCIIQKSDITKPSIDHFCSDTFSFEQWKENDRRGITAK